MVVSWFVTKVFLNVDIFHFNLDLCKEKHLPRRCISQIFNGWMDKHMMPVFRFVRMDFCLW